MNNYKSIPSIFVLLLLSSFAFAQKPVAHFTSDCKILCYGSGVGQIGDDEVGFTYDGTGGAPTSYAWTFPSGTPATSANANPGTITFTTVGTYLVSVTATNANGSSTFTDTIFVVNSCSANIGISTDSFNICRGACVNFIDKSNFRPDTWSWTFPGENAPAPGDTAYHQNPQHICYDNVGHFSVQLTASRTNSKCFNQASATLNVTVANCGINGIQPIDFNDALTIYPIPVTSQLSVTGSSLQSSLIEVTNILGSRILTQKATANENTIDVSQLTPGVYFLSVKYSNRESEVRKFVKK